MNEQKLSQRLEAVSSYIPKGAVLADIGSDHAYLPCYAVLNELAEEAIAGEVVEGPFQSAVEQVAKSGLENRIEVRKGSGLSVLEKGEADCITIAGMGGTLITKILEEGRSILSGKERLILQPNVNANNIRKWLIDNEWQLLHEQILEEDEKIYEILVAEKGAPLLHYSKDKLETELLLGPILMRENSDVFEKKWKNERKHWERVLSDLSKAPGTPENLRKTEELKMKIKEIEEAVNNE
ncbi:tRNA (adenine(22)-N(1))-methyltransferase TrmK [Bacillus lacus]|uniref:tRNA (Adenine(22)-N(1))-methyltransferase TrmK n=1 Tax=Metabacillus lacus TaxID=1983721 RepID=A0A7X2IX88_9BACI|nr:tRNA (adenine(22)-N(1))-methyltransferase TrmK [Metabacillus lacus]MRX71289.1 tRNA (adenine(22)-N(1))-methyltransferase TrmK [Metabacillus lacus]